MMSQSRRIIQMDLVWFLSEWIAIQVVPRLSKRIGLPLDLPPENMLYGMNGGGEFTRILEDYRRCLRSLIEEHGVSWWDVYTHSDIGLERLSLAEKMRIDDGDIVLEVGCGMGYFTIPVASICERIFAMDLMNGFGRRGWWAGLRAEMTALGLEDKVAGDRADATQIPFRDGSFSLAVSAHALRNFRDRDVVVKALQEMRRVTREGGRVVVAENLPIAKTKSQEAHLRMFECKAAFVAGETPFYSEEEMISIFGEAGMCTTRSEIIDFGLSAAPPIWMLDPNKLPEEERAEAQEEFLEAVNLMRTYGEMSTPVLIVEATRE